MDILMKALYLLIFPGLLYCSVAGLLLAGIDRKVVARMQKRIGPPLLQPAYDFFKLLGKETIVPAAAARRTFLAAPVIGLVSLVVTAVLVPVFGFSAFGGVADVVVILYLLTIPAVAIIMGGAASGSPYAGVGISREMVTMMAYELPLVIILLAVGKAAGDGGVTFSLSKIVEYQQANGPLITHWTMWPAALAMLLVIPAEIGSHPFDVAEAETEICEGALVEYSGAPLAVFKLSSAIKLYIMTALFSCLFLSGWGTG
ncbi:MAG: NADH-quinone oxidoreductase subunit H, partial [Firmicutes bacterium]|nr:NADH-quinone oxidoreductase subunit H [Bacillota bacterium]